MPDPYDPMKDPTKHVPPTKKLVDKVIELALSAGGGVTTLLSGLLAAVLILYSGYVLYDSFATEQAASSSAWDLLQFKPELFDDYETPLSGTDLAEINNDYRAWLTVYNTPIDYPVVQGKDDLYYASHDIYNRVSLTGAIYLAAANSPDFSDSYNVIYGHHMDNGAMFGSLDNMSGSETGTIITKKKIYDVQFFAVVNTDAYESQIYTVGNRMDSVLDFLRSGGAGGVGLGTQVTYFNAAAAADAIKVVALSTCANANTNGRLVVFGKMTERIFKKDVTVKKVWDDADDQDGIRPDSITVTASDGTKVKLTAENNWTATVSLLKFDDNGEISYTWSEPNIPGYTLVSNVTEGDTTTLTNRHIPATQSLTVRKVWNDDNNRDGLRPQNLTVTLSNRTEVLLNAANNWTATVDNLPVYENGTAIEYSWTEANVNGYTEAITVDGLVTTITNTHVPGVTELTVTKVWEDFENEAGLRPQTLTVTLVANGTALQRVTLSAENGWTATVASLPAYENGEEIRYTWSEPEVLGYTQTGNTTVDGTTTITNTLRGTTDQDPSVQIDEYETPLGLEVETNHAGNTFD